MTTQKDFSCIGGLDKHINIVKEMVLFPLMYGWVYSKFHLRPPRGLLFYGPPGTGKTLVASALAVECSNSERKVSFISRKGSDCLSKYVGESEHKLQKIFTMAQQNKPCIIFFDEVDGLAPVRTSRQDFVHASVVSTLLALMDGLDNNSEIIVIGATNRLDAIDPALRRPGRFDRELYFPLPCYTARKDILSVHVKNWKQKPAVKFIAYLASKTVGYGGSDLQALCAEAVMCCVRRHYPQIYTSKAKHQINERALKVEKQDFMKAQQSIVPASHRVSIIPIKCLSPKVYPLLQDTLFTILSVIQGICPAGMLTSENPSNEILSTSTRCPRLLLHGDDDCHTRHLAPAILHNLEHLPCHVLDVTSLFEETGRAAEETIIQKVKIARHTLPSLLYVPDMMAWWDLVGEAARVVFTSLMKGLDRSVHMLFLATITCNTDSIPIEILELFDVHQSEIFEVSVPGPVERLAYFQQIFTKVPGKSDNISSRSSYVDFVQVLGPIKSKVEGKRSKEVEIIETPIPKRRKEGKIRMKLSAVHSTSSGNGPIPRNGLKRVHSASGEGTSSKRQRGCGNSRRNSFETLTELQVQDLLDRAVDYTEDWTCHQLETIHAALERVLNYSEGDVFPAFTKCLENFRKNQRTRDVN
ncbi:ATPase family AAA domain-containing protein 2 [Fopius arisanus]|uniref:ATPase family AAA domain-containing protein 2 n=2 Tax=Fopius arisanus TaxID=64838 RepID=A0A9R1TUM1_9HYME|nr:PREDICTED: ATPase family AAA domain-containing protein 2-like [Fopius arisanus]